MSSTTPKQPKAASPLSNVFDLGEYRMETRPVSEIKIDKKHPRKISSWQAEKAACIMRAARYMLPIILNQEGNLIAGEEWLEGANILGAEKVQVLLYDQLSEAQVRALRNAYYKIMEDGEWDKKNLAEDFRFLLNAELNSEIDFSVDITGFDTPEIDIVLSESFPSELDVPAPEVAVAPDIPCVSNPGDLWLLGQHTICCGNSIDPATYQKLLGNTAIDLIFSDPPYNVKIDGFVSGNGVVKHGEFAMASGEMSEDEFIEFLYFFLLYALANLKDGCCVYLTIDWRHVDQLLAATKRCGLYLLNMCVWDKGVGAMGSLYRSQYELVLVLRKGKTQHMNNVQLGKYGRNRTNVWQYPSANMSKEGRKALKDHPTPKPVAMIADIMRDVTKPGDTVLDPFLGGGASLIAAEKTGRICYGIELDPRYIDASIRRWQEMTGKQAVHAETGMTFAEYESKGGQQ